MRRALFLLIAVAVTVGVSVNPALAFRIPPPPTPGQQAIAAEFVVVGKVTALEKDLVELPALIPIEKGEKEKYRIAVVKVETDLSGANKPKELRIGFIRETGPDAKKNNFEPKEGQQLLLCLTKHPRADFYLPPYRWHGSKGPQDVTTAAGKAALEDVKKTLAVLADPLKALKSDKAEVRSHAAIVMLQKYLVAPDYASESEPGPPIDAEESRLILKGLAEAEWKLDKNGNYKGDSAFNVFHQLPIDQEDGWKGMRALLQVALDKKVDFVTVVRDEFVKWVAGPGKDYRIKKLVSKK
jgi:hypothetical protein